MTTLPEVEVDELLALDARVFRNYAAPGHPPVDMKTHATAVAETYLQARYAVVRRQERLAAYIALRPLEGPTWFVTAIAVDPDQRSPAVLRALYLQLRQILQAEGITTLVSNVYRGNAPSLRLHHRLGFAVTRSNDQGFEFTLTDAQTRLATLIGGRVTRR